MIDHEKKDVMERTVTTTIKTSNILEVQKSNYVTDHNYFNNYAMAAIIDSLQSQLMHYIIINVISFWLWINSYSTVCVLLRLLLLLRSNKDSSKSVGKLNVFEYAVFEC